MNADAGNKRWLGCPLWNSLARNGRHKLGGAPRAGIAVTSYFPLYRCGARILNAHRPSEQQLKDWHRVRSVLRTP
jgi:hypothetical protein